MPLYSANITLAGIGKKSGPTLSRSHGSWTLKFSPIPGSLRPPLALVGSASPLQVLSGAQGTVGHHHADLGLRFGVELGAAGVEQRGDVLVGCEFSAGPYLVASFAHLTEF